jgi:hypothetical protein
MEGGDHAGTRKYIRTEVQGTGYTMGNKLMTGRAGGGKYIGMSLRKCRWGIIYIGCVPEESGIDSVWLDLDDGGASANTQ